MPRSRRAMPGQCRSPSRVGLSEPRAQIESVALMWPRYLSMADAMRCPYFESLCDAELSRLSDGLIMGLLLNAARNFSVSRTFPCFLIRLCRSLSAAIIERTVRTPSGERHAILPLGRTLNLTSSTVTHVDVSVRRALNLLSSAFMLSARPTMAIVNISRLSVF